jgi:hypothetical protein
MLYVLNCVALGVFITCGIVFLSEWLHLWPRHRASTPSAATRERPHIIRLDIRA